MSIFSRLLGKDESKKYFEEASKLYEARAGESREAIAAGKAEGRKDITAGKKEALGYQEPYIGAGKASLAALQSSLGIGEGATGEQGVYSKFTRGPGYALALSQGLKSVQAANAARGLTGSGAEAMQLQQTGQGMAELSWEKYLANYQNRLADLAGMGQKSAAIGTDVATGAGAGLANLGLQYAGQDVGVLQSLGKSQAEAKMAAGQIEAQKTAALWQGLGSVVGGAMKFA